MWMNHPDPPIYDADGQTLSVVEVSQAAFDTVWSLKGWVACGAPATLPSPNPDPYPRYADDTDIVDLTNRVNQLEALVGQGGNPDGAASVAYVNSSVSDAKHYTDSELAATLAGVVSG